MSSTAWLYVAANIGIFFGYVFLAFGVVPRVTVELHRTRYGGILFFLTCGLTHLDQAYHTYYNPTETYFHISTQPHMLAIHVVQFFAVWAFVTGLYIEFVKWGPWGQARK